MKRWGDKICDDAPHTDRAPPGSTQPCGNGRSFANPIKVPNKYWQRAAGTPSNIPAAPTQGGKEGLVIYIEGQGSIPN